MEFGDHSPPTTSGTTTMVLILSVEILDSEKVLEPNPETTTTEKTSTTKLDIEDAQEDTQISFNAEDMVDQTTMTRAPKLMSTALENHGNQIMSRPEVNSESQLKVG
jgi:hypothetical protein